MRFRKLHWLMMLLCVLTLSASVIADDDDDDDDDDDCCRRYHCRSICVPCYPVPTTDCDPNTPGSQVSVPAYCPHTPLDLHSSVPEVWTFSADYYYSNCQSLPCEVNAPWNSSTGLPEYVSDCKVISAQGCCHLLCGNFAKYGKKPDAAPCLTSPKSWQNTHRPHGLDPGQWDITEYYIRFDAPGVDQTIRAKAWKATLKTDPNRKVLVGREFTGRDPASPGPTNADSATCVPTGHKCHFAVTVGTDVFAIRTVKKETANCPELR